MPDALQPTSATNYVVSTLTSEGIKPLLRLLTGQPARMEPPLHPIKILPPEQDAPTVELRLLAGSSGRSADDELARHLANLACQHARISAVDLGLVAAADGAAAVVPIVAGRDVLGRWIRTLHQEIKTLNREHRQRHRPGAARPASIGARIVGRGNRHTCGGPRQLRNGPNYARRPRY